MSLMYSIIFILFLASTISATAAPKDVYSAIIHNTQGSSIQCNIIWSGPSDHTLESGLFTVENNENYSVHEKTIKMDGWEARAVIQEIHCGHLVRRAPFPGVESPKTNWDFFVTANEITSG